MMSLYEGGLIAAAHIAQERMKKLISKRCEEGISDELREACTVGFVEAGIILTEIKLLGPEINWEKLGFADI